MACVKNCPNCRGYREVWIGFDVKENGMLSRISFFHNENHPLRREWGHYIKVLVPSNRKNSKAGGTIDLRKK